MFEYIQLNGCIYLINSKTRKKLHKADKPVVLYNHKSNQYVKAGNLDDIIKYIDFEILNSGIILRKIPMQIDELNIYASNKDYIELLFKEYGLEH